MRGAIKKLDFWGEQHNVRRRGADLREGQETEEGGGGVADLPKGTTASERGGNRIRAFADKEQAARS